MRYPWVISAAVLFYFLYSASVQAVSWLDVRLLVQICGKFQRALSVFGIPLLVGYTPSIRTLDTCKDWFAVVSLLCGVSCFDSLDWTGLNCPT